MSEWAGVQLSDLLDQVDERRGDQDVPLVLSVTEKRGIIPQVEVFKKRIATEDTSNYKVLQPLDIAYNPYLLWTGAIGQWDGQEPGVTSPVYETFRVRAEHDPRFVGLILTSGVLTPYFDATAIGSIQRRRRTPVPVFLAAEATVPQLPE
jgi:type I restriction enzyme, S subunit